MVQILLVEMAVQEVVLVTIVARVELQHQDKAIMVEEVMLQLQLMLAVLVEVLELLVELLQVELQQQEV